MQDTENDQFITSDLEENPVRESLNQNSAKSLVEDTIAFGTFLQPDKCFSYRNEKLITQPGPAVIIPAAGLFDILLGGRPDKNVPGHTTGLDRSRSSTSRHGVP